MNRAANPFGVVCMFLMVLGSACDDVDDGTMLAVEKFEFRECKDGSTGELLTGRETSNYGGLECVAWEFGSGDIALDLINRPAGCGFGGSDHDEALWKPAVKQLSASRIEYDVQWNFSDPSACGGCLHDFSVRVSDAKLGERVQIEVATRSCNAKDCVWSRDSVRTGDESSGIRCRYIANDTGSHYDWGKIGLRPRNDGSCDSELVARQGEDGETRCLLACAEDSDCSAADVQRCVEGSCQLRDPW